MKYLCLSEHPYHTKIYPQCTLALLAWDEYHTVLGCKGTGSEIMLLGATTIRCYEVLIEVELASGQEQKMEIGREPKSGGRLYRFWENVFDLVTIYLWWEREFK